MSNALIQLTDSLSSSLGMGSNGAELIQSLKATCFKGEVSDAQMLALMVVANQYGLNPWTREIYAYPDKQNGIVPVVGVDGWSRIINSHTQFDGMTFDINNEYCTCTIYRKDRTHPVQVTEFMSECLRPAFNKNGYEIKTPWQTHPLRMLRHKAMIQCARLAFGFVGIYDKDEAEFIASSEINMGNAVVENNAPDLDALAIEIGKTGNRDEIIKILKREQKLGHSKEIFETIRALCTEQRLKLEALQNG